MPTALDSPHLIHKPSPSSSWLLLLQLESLLTPPPCRGAAASCCILHTLSHGLAEIQAPDSLQSLLSQGYGM